MFTHTRTHASTYVTIRKTYRAYYAGGSENKIEPVVTKNGNCRGNNAASHTVAPTTRRVVGETLPRGWRAENILWPMHLAAIHTYIRFSVIILSANTIDTHSCLLRTVRARWITSARFSEFACSAAGPTASPFKLLCPRCKYNDGVAVRTSQNARRHL